MIPGLDVYMKRDAQNFVLVHSCVHPRMGCSTEFGAVTRMTRAEMEQHGLDAIQKSLSEYPQRVKATKSELESLSEAEQEKFDREHKQVSVSLQKGSELWLAPMHRGVRGGKISGDMSETEIVKLPATPEAFFKGLLAAMNVAD